MRFADHHRTVIGFHGTTRETAESVVTGGNYKRSVKQDEWLGHGTYFWEYAPKQAWRWAKQHYSQKTEVAVLGSMIRLGNCFDLLDPDNAEVLIETKKQLENELGSKTPKNVRARKYLDCAVFEKFYELMDEADASIDSARAVYVPTQSADRLWNSSWLYGETHLQLCVRNKKCILGTWLVQPEKE